MSALTNDGSSAIQQMVEISNHSGSSYICLSKHLDEYTIEQFNECYKIKECVDIIMKYNFKNVALQFPDELLMDASLISFQLKSLFNSRRKKHDSEESKPSSESVSIEPTIGDIEDMSHASLSLLSQIALNSEYVKQSNNDANLLRVYVLGDTSYGSCCVDEVGAQHMCCDFIIHYGNACLQPLNISDCCNALTSYVEEDPTGEVIVIYDLVNYERIQRELVPLITSDRVVFAKLYTSRVLQNVKDAPVTELDENENKIGSQIFSKPSDKARFFFIGELGSFVTQVMMEFNTHTFKVFSSYKNKVENDGSGNISRTLGRRFALVQKAKEAQVFGILVSTVSVENYLKMVEYVKRLILDNDRKFYLFFVGKLNVPKLANFMEIDMFVLIGCSQNSLIDSRDYVKPIITPFELELALKYGKEWTGYYQLDYNSIFEDDSSEAPQPPPEDSEDNYEASLFTGGVYRVGKSTVSSKDVLNSNDDGKSIVLQQQQQRQLMETQYTPSMLYLKNRTYKGLGQDEEDESSNQNFTTIEQGRSGIASSYKDEKH